jgi:hypothetical protein
MKGRWRGDYPWAREAGNLSARLASVAAAKKKLMGRPPRESFYAAPAHSRCEAVEYRVGERVVIEANPLACLVDVILDVHPRRSVDGIQAGFEDAPAEPRSVTIPVSLQLLANYRA